MLVEFEDDDLRLLYEDANFRVPRLGRDIVRSYRKVVGIVVAANDERDLYAMRSLNYEKLKGGSDRPALVAAEPAVETDRQAAARSRRNANDHDRDRGLPLTSILGRAGGA
jgi:plasmid maintenance system killer protein